MVDLGPTLYKRPALSILRSLMPYLSTRPTTTAGLTQLDLIGPLFRLLGSEFTEDTMLILEGTVQAEMAAQRCAPVQMAHDHDATRADPAVVVVASGTSACGPCGARSNVRAAPGPMLGVDAWTGRPAWWAKSTTVQQTVRWKLGQVPRAPGTGTTTMPSSL